MSREKEQKVRGSITMHDLTPGMNASLASFSKLGIQACPETDADTSFTFSYKFPALITIQVIRTKYPSQDKQVKTITVP